MATQHDSCTEHGAIVTEINNLKASDAKQWEAIEQIKNRLPVWGTAIISLLTFLLGASLTYAGLVTRIATVAKP
jgi:hypothetical protein